MTRECSVIWRPDPKCVEGEGRRMVVRSCENTRDRMGDTLHIRLMTLNRLGRWGEGRVLRCDRSV
jgi:hypothetical protein